MKTDGEYSFVRLLYTPTEKAAAGGGLPLSRGSADRCQTAACPERGIIQLKAALKAARQE